MERIKKFKLEEESIKSKELEETCAKIRDAASALGNTGQYCIVMKEFTQFDRICRIGKMQVSVFLW